VENRQIERSAEEAPNGIQTPRPDAGYFIDSHTVPDPAFNL
jgi:hypothetical protein